MQQKQQQRCSKNGNISAALRLQLLHSSSPQDCSRRDFFNLCQSSQ
jgi:hypothetical protein